MTRLTLDDIINSDVSDKLKILAKLIKEELNRLGVSYEEIGYRDPSSSIIHIYFFPWPRIYNWVFRLYDNNLYFLGIQHDYDLDKISYYEKINIELALEKLNHEKNEYIMHSILS